MCSRVVEKGSAVVARRVRKCMAFMCVFSCNKRSTGGSEASVCSNSTHDRDVERDRCFSGHQTASLCPTAGFNNTQATRLLFPMRV